MAAAAGAPEISRTRRNSFSIFDHNPERDSTIVVRDALLVVAALVVAATFQVAVNPPGGVWQETLVVNGTVSHYAGTAVIASRSPHAYLVFLSCNTVAFSSSALIIFHLVYDFPFYKEAWTALVAMVATYGISVVFVRPPDININPYLFPALFLPSVVSYMMRLINWLRYKNNRQQRHH